MSQKKIPELLTIQEVSKILKCTPTTLRNWDTSGILEAIRIDKKRVYRREDIESFIAKTKRMKEDRLALSQEIVFPQFIDASPEPILITDTAARIFYVNPAWEKLVGYSLDEVRGENPRFLQSGKTPKKIHTSLWKSLSKGQTFVTREIVNKKKNGEEFQVHASYFPIIKDGKPVFYVQILHDISRQIELEKQKDAFIGIASHELKTPITTLFDAQILQKKLAQKGDEKEISLLSNIVRETKRLTALIDDLLNVSRLQSQKLTFQPEIFDINPFMHQIVDDMALMTDTHTITIEGSVEGDVIADKNRVEQVLNNLLTNAIKYSPNADTIIIHLSSKKNNAIVAVQDFGFGIAKEDQPHIFQRFYRTKDKDEGKIKGFGLGLYITSEILRKSKGKIWVESKKGKGSTFSFSLPLAKSK